MVKYLIISYTHILNGKHTTLGGPAVALSEYLGEDCECVWQPIPIGKPTWMHYFIKLRDIWLILGNLSLFQETEVWICVESVNTIVGALLRKIGAFQHRLVYWNIDFGTKRGFLWTLCDKLAIRLADEVWVLSEASIKARGGIKKPYKILPIGCWFHKIPRLTYEQIDKRHIVYIGLLEELQGVGLLIEAVKEMKDVTLTIIGGGPDEEKFKKQANEKTKFFGILSDDCCRSILCKASLGVAMYDVRGYNNSSFTDPTKPKTYLSCGLPVVITNIGIIAQMIDQEGAGILVSYDKNCLISAIEEILDNLETYRMDAINLAEKFDWERIFKELLPKGG